MTAQMVGSSRRRRRLRHVKRAMAKAGLKSCGCCVIGDDRQTKQIAAALADLRSQDIGRKVRL